MASELAGGVGGGVVDLSTKGNSDRRAVFSFTERSMCGLSLAPHTQVTEIFALGRGRYRMFS